MIERTVEPLSDRPPDQEFEPDQSSLAREPLRCPHCGEPLPAEPEILEPSERVYGPTSPRARYSGELRRVEIFGGDSPFTEADPYVIEDNRVGSHEDVPLWMARIAAKGWARGEEFFLELADTLQEARKAA